MGPHPEAEEADRGPGEDHCRIPEQWLAGEGGEDLGDHPHGGEDQDVDLGMAEQPEQVLPQDRVPASHGLEEE